MIEERGSGHYATNTPTTAPTIAAAKTTADREPVPKCREAPLFCVAEGVAADELVDVGAVAVEDELLPDDDGDTEDDVEENGLENVEGTDVGKEIEVLVDARAQNCSAIDSAELRSDEVSVVHCVEIQDTREFAKRVAL